MVPKGGAAAGTAPSWRSPVFGGSLLGSLRSVPVAPTMPRPPLVPGSYHSVQPHTGTLYVVGRAPPSAAPAPNSALPPLEFAAPPPHQVPDTQQKKDEEDEEDEEEDIQRPRFLSSVPIDRVPLLSMYTPFSGAGGGAGGGVGVVGGTRQTPLGGIDDSDSDAFEGIFSPSDTPELQEVTDAGDFLAWVSRARALHAFQHSDQVSSAFLVCVSLFFSPLFSLFFTGLFQTHRNKTLPRHKTALPSLSKTFLHCQRLLHSPLPSQPPLLSLLVETSFSFFSVFSFFV